MESTLNYLANLCDHLTPTTLAAMYFDLTGTDKFGSQRIIYGALVANVGATEAHQLIRNHAAEYTIAEPAKTTSK